jgi:hypothetical protein
MSAERLAPLPAAIFALALVYGIFTAGLEIEPRFWRWAGLRAERRHREMLKRVAAAEHECGLDGHKDVDWHGDHYTWHYGDKYAGPHGVCYMSLESKAKQFRAALSDLRHTISANAEVGHEIRLLLLPGIKRKTYRREELQSSVDAADGSRA